MKLIISGGRNYNLTSEDYGKIESLHLYIGITEVVCGTPYDPSKGEPPTGADQCGAAWAYENDISVKDMEPNWNNITRPGAVVRTRRDGKKYDAAAGPARNRRMAKYADAVALFPGGRGTASMYEEAMKTGIQIFDFRSQ